MAERERQPTNRMTDREKYRLFDWFRANWPELSATVPGPTDEELAKMAAERLGYRVTVANVRNAMEVLEIKRQTPTASTSAEFAQLARAVAMLRTAVRAVCLAHRSSGHPIRLDPTVYDYLGLTGSDPNGPTLFDGPPAA